MSFSRSPLMLVGVLFLAGCEPGIGTLPSDDAGTATGDAGRVDDGGVQLDAGQPFDAGEVDAGISDAGPTVDSGVDAGSAVDAGVPVDAGSSGDAGSAVDAGGTVDAGTPVDAGSTLDAGGAVDSGTPVDAGRVDAGSPDAGRVDSGTADAGRPDAGQADAGQQNDAGVPADGGSEPALATVTFTESDAGLLNPERGFYGSLNLTSTSTYSSARARGQTLGLAGVKLDAFKNSAIDTATLNAISAGFTRVRAAGLKVILRFQYNSGPIGATDASRTQILAHITQLQPILQANADVIAMMQGGFIGAWGEWHSSTNGLDNATDRNAILQALLTALPSSRMVQVRTPHFVNDAYPSGVLTAAQAFSGSNQARTGHHNDCFLASDSDQGTYQTPYEMWKTYVANSGRFTPVGGETCGTYPPRSECAVATAELSRLHFRYLNSEYEPDVLASWVTGGCMPAIQQRLGYRFVMEQVQYSSSVRPGGLLRVQAVIRNDGYGAIFNQRPLQVVLEQGSTVLRANLNSIDLRKWETGTQTVDVRLRLPAGIATGNWRVSLASPDADSVLSQRADYAIQFANTNTWDATKGVNVIVPQLSVSASAPGQVDPNATQFVEVP